MSWGPKKWPCGHPKYPSQTFCWDCGKDSKQSPSRTRTQPDEDRTPSEVDRWACGHDREPGTTSCWECPPSGESRSGTRETWLESIESWSDAQKVLIGLLIAVPITLGYYYMREMREARQEASHRAAYPCMGIISDAAWASHQRALKELKSFDNAWDDDVRSRSGGHLGVAGAIMSAEGPAYRAQREAFVKRVRAAGAAANASRKCYSRGLSTWVYRSVLFKADDSETKNYYCDACVRAEIDRFPDQRECFVRLRKN